MALHKVVRPVLANRGKVCSQTLLQNMVSISCECSMGQGETTIRTAKCKLHQSLLLSNSKFLLQGVEVSHGKLAFDMASECSKVNIVLRSNHTETGSFTLRFE